METDAKVLKFHATWCQPCKALSKTIEEAGDLGIEIESIDVDQEPELARKYNIRSVPTMVVVDEEGEVLRYQTGSMSLHQLESFINNV